ncbi:MAG: RIP metalloprotease RseP [Bacteroidia bacterium]
MLTLGLFLLALSLLILVHELGHFLPARLFGMRVEKFYLFFDWPFALFRWRSGKTEYGIGVLPLGGYVKIAGMAEEGGSSGPTAPDEFRSKPLLQRMLVVAGGPLMNILYAILVLFGLFYFEGIHRVAIYRWEYGLEAQPILNIQTGDRLLAINGSLAYLDRVASPEWLLVETPSLTLVRGGDTLKQYVSPALRDSLLYLYGRGQEVFLLRLPARIDPVQHGPGWRAGLRKGDEILSVNHQRIHSFQELRQALQKVVADSVVLGVRRNSKELFLTARLDSQRRLQVLPQVELPIERRQLSLDEAFVESLRNAYRITGNNLRALYYLITGKMRLSENLSGPIGIARAAGQTYTTGGWRGFLAFTAGLSLILAVMNLLPVPLLDGGHLVFLSLEAVLRREPSYQLRLVAQYIGLALILTLMIVAFWNDIRKL